MISISDATTKETPIGLRFGELEAVLADLNGIPSHQRTAFQARLKNFHRLGFPAGIGQGRGKAVIYTARELILMAVAVELTQLGLTPERVIEVITDDELPVWYSVNLAVGALKARPEVFNRGPGDTRNPPDQKVWGFSPKWADSDDTDPFSMFLYCDPAALAPWTEDDEDRASATFFYGGVGVVRDNISRWTTGPTRRLALINVTKLLFDMAVYLAVDKGLEVVEQFGEAATAWITHGDFDLDDWLVGVSKRLMHTVAAAPPFLKNMDSWVTLPNLLKDLPAKHDFRRITQMVPQEISEGEYKDRTAPDMIVRLPGQRTLMVDAKVIPSADIPQMGIYSRLEDLAEQPYRTQFTDRTEYIVLYIPSEKFYEQAAAAEHHIFEHGLEQKVIIATPTVFLNLLGEAVKAWEKYRAEFPDNGEEEWSELPEEVHYGDDQEA